MDTRFGPTLKPGAFESPFDDIVADFVERGCALHDSLTQHMRPEWKQRQLEILIVDNPSLNAYADDGADRDQIYIFHGAIEHIYGAILGLLSVPTCLRAIGDIKKEVRPQSLPGGRFPRVPLLRNAPRAEQRTRLFFPNDQERMTVAQILAELALEFLVYHEIGHIVGGHRRIRRNSARLSPIAEFQYALNKPDDSTLEQVLECDADAFECHVTSWVHTHERMAVLMPALVNAPESQSREFALLTYLTAVGALFRVLYPDAPLTIDAYDSSHPHPAVRACLIASSAMARGLYDGKYTPHLLTRIVAESVGNIEDVWADLCLSGQNPEPPDLWAKHVHDAAMALFESYANTRALLERYAWLPRRWDDWDWPKSQ